jgi:hypothetical protein
MNIDIDVNDIKYINDIHDGPFLIRWTLALIVFAIWGAIELIFFDPSERFWFGFGGMFLFITTAQWLDSEFYLVRRDTVGAFKEIQKIEGEISALRGDIASKLDAISKVVSELR